MHEHPAQALVNGDPQRVLLTFETPGGTTRSWTRGWLADVVARRAGALRAHGLEPGDRIAVVADDPEDFTLTFLAAVWSGLVPAAIPPAPVLGRHEAHRESARAVLAVARCRLLVACSSLPGLLPGRELRGADLSGGLADPPHECADNDLLFLQPTSGSTGTPRCVRVTRRSLAANAAALLGDGMRVDPDVDIGVGWLPLHHDMGLIGFLLAPMLHDLPVVLLPPTAFVRDPACWLRSLERHRGTISFAPTSAYALATRRARSVARSLDLSAVRVLGCGSEPVQRGVLDAFAAAFAPAGLRPDVFLPAYGLAEATLAVTLGRLGAGVETDPSGGVLCGPPLPGHQVALVGPDGAPVREGEEGDLLVRGPSVTAGYEGDEAATRAAYRSDGWLRTGDMGRLHQGELVVTGRTKDLVIVHGRNVASQQVERLVEELPGVGSGRAAAFGRPGDDTEEIVVALEVARHDPDLPRRIRRHLVEQLRVSAGDVVLVPPGTLERTTSGKLRRQRIRAAYLAGDLSPRSGSR